MMIRARHLAHIGHVNRALLAADGSQHMIVPAENHGRGSAHVEIAPGDSGLAQASYAKSEDIKSISTERLVRRLGRAQSASLDQIGRALALLLELA